MEECTGREKKRIFSRRNFLLGSLATATTIWAENKTGLITEALKYVTSHNENEAQIRERELTQLRTDLNEFCGFYLHYSNLNECKSDKLSDSEKSLLFSGIRMYLMIPRSLIPNEDMSKYPLESISLDTYPNFFEDFDTESVILAKKVLIERYKFVLEIQNILYSKLESVNEDGNNLRNFVDGELGSKSMAMIYSIVRKPINLEDILLYDKKQRSIFIQLLKQGKLELISANFEESLLLFAKDISNKLNQYKIEKNFSPQEIRSKLSGARDLISKEKDSLRLIENESVRIEKAKMLMVVFINYLVEIWKITPVAHLNSEKKHAKLPSREKYADCTTLVFYILRELFPKMSEKLMLNGAPEQILAYRDSTSGDFYGGNDLNDKTGRRTGIFVAAKTNHMQLLYPNLTDFAQHVYEASYGAGRIIDTLDVGSFFYQKGGRVEITSNNAIKRWLDS